MSGEFGSTGFYENVRKYVSLSINLKTPVEAGSSEKGKGTVGFRYVIVPAIGYQKSSYEGIPVGKFDEFSNSIELSGTKSIEAGKVYDVLCECGLEEDEGGGFWGD